MRITYSHHARKRLREKCLTRTDVQHVLQNRGPAHPSPRKRAQEGRALDGERIRVVYTEARAGEFLILSVITPDRK